MIGFGVGGIVGLLFTCGGLQQIYFRSYIAGARVWIQKKEKGRRRAGNLELSFW